MNKLSLSVKEELKSYEVLAEEKDKSLFEFIKNKLDANGDGILTKDDFIFAINKFLDVNGDGKVSIWEYITLFFRIRKILKKIKR